MNEFQYLVMLSHDMDDVPLLIVDDLDSAFEFAEVVDWSMTDNVLSGVLDLPDMSTPNCVSVVTFRDGTPCSRVVFRRYDDDDDRDYGTGVDEPDPTLKV